MSDGDDARGERTADPRPSVRRGATDVRPNEPDGVGRTPTRRGVLAAGAALAGVGLAGCTSFPWSDGDGNESGGGGGGSAPDLSAFRGSGPLVAARSAPGGTPMADLPSLSGELTVYLGGGESGLYRELFDLLQRTYPDFTPMPRAQPSASHAQNIVQEVRSGGSPADVFVSVDAGSLAYVAENEAAVELPSEVLDPVPDDYHADRWVGIEGRARTVPYNTDALSADDIPQKVQQFTEADGLRDAMGWAPTYGAFQSFVTAMRLLRGPEETKAWLRGMLDQGVREYRDEWFVSNNVADGAIAAGFANHYYALRVRNARPDAPLDLAFTTNDAGALVNVSGALVVQGTDQSELATNFVRHLLSAEAQEFFATRTFGYPMVPEVAPVGGLPTIDELNPPDVPLQELSDLKPTLDLMREVGVL